MDRTSVIRFGSLWKTTEEQLQRSGAYLPLYQSYAFIQQSQPERFTLLTLKDDSGEPAAGVAIQEDSSHVLPLHKNLRVRRFGHGIPPEQWEPLLAALARHARSDACTLRLSIGVFARTAEEKQGIYAALTAYGFQKMASPQLYRYTLTLDLQQQEDEIRQSLHKSARKRLQEADRAGIHIQPLKGSGYAARLHALQNEALQRTGGHTDRRNWESILALSTLYPNLSRLTGFFASADDTRPEALLGFSWGCLHGDHAEYCAAGTTRLPYRLPISYPLLWDLILWAKQQGAIWFDLGGITLSNSAEDPLAGISEFKRYFSRTVEEVGSEWVLEPHPLRSQLAANLKGTALQMRNLVSGLRRA